jgi:hypothetical protein
LYRNVSKILITKTTPSILLAGVTEVGSQFRRGLGGSLVGGVGKERQGNERKGKERNGKKRK